MVVFLMARATGDPVTLLASDKATAQDIAELNRSAEVPLVGLGDHRDVCDLRRVRSAGVPLRPDRAINNTSTSIAANTPCCSISTRPNPKRLWMRWSIPLTSSCRTSPAAWPSDSALVTTEFVAAKLTSCTSRSAPMATAGAWAPIADLRATPRRR